MANYFPYLHRYADVYYKLHTSEAESCIEKLCETYPTSGIKTDDDRVAYDLLISYLHSIETFMVLDDDVIDYRDKLMTAVGVFTGEEKDLMEELLDDVSELFERVEDYFDQDKEDEKK